MEHTLTYKGDGVDVSGVVSVESFDQKYVLLKLEGGLLEMRGGDFALKDMAAGRGKVSFSGRIRSLEYKEKIEPSSILKKLFK